MTMNEMRSIMSKCKYYTRDAKTENGVVKIQGRCYGMKLAPNVSCSGDETKCEICKTDYKTAAETQSDLHYELVSEIVFQVKITEKNNTVKKVYCYLYEDVISLIRAELSITKNIQITPIKNLYYRSK